MAEYFSVDLSEKVRAGMYQTALKGKTIGGQTPLGYKIVNDKLEIDPITAPIVREAFERYAKGETVASICEDFNRRGFRSKRGAKFNKNSFHHMFKNKKYIGVFTYSDIVRKDVVPPIVSQEVFNKVQSKLNKRKAAPASGNTKVDYRLTFKLVCGECGGYMTGTSGTSKQGKSYYYYECPNNRKKQTCNKKPVRKDLIEDIVIKETMKLLTPTLIDDLADMAMREVERENNNNTLINALKAEIDHIDKSLNNLIRVLETIPDSTTTLNRLRELEKTKKVTQRRLAEEQSNIIKLDRDMIIFWLTKFLDGDIDSPRFQKNLLSLLVNTVTVKDSTDGPEDFDLAITYNLTSEKNP